MTKSPLDRHRNVQMRAVEFQGRFHDVLTRAAADARREPARNELGPYITISRQAATGGVEIAHMVAKRWGWSVLDKELVEGIAHHLELAPRMLELMDETRTDWFSESFLTLLEPRLLTQDSYVSMLCKIVLLAAYDGRVIIVGRGAGLMLPREPGLAVRIVAPRASRLARLCHQENLEPRAAGKRLDEIDASRETFVRRHFHCDPEDPTCYDLVVDSDALGLEGAAEIICHAAELRGLTRSRPVRSSRAVPEPAPTP